MKQDMLRTLFLALLLVHPLLAKDFVWQHTGIFDKEAANDFLEAIDEDKDSDRMVLIIESTGGDLPSALAMAKRVKRWKREGKGEVLVYIHDGVVGPLAVLPFVGDKIISTPYMSWGDIPLGNIDTVPANLLRSQVEGLIESDEKHKDILTLLAAAMTDPKVIVIDDNGQWKLAPTTTATNIVSPPDQTLIINQHQFNYLHMMSDVLPLDEFFVKYDVKKKPPPPPTP